MVDIAADATKYAPVVTNRGGRKGESMSISRVIAALPALMLLSVLSASLPAPATAAFPGANGRIVFQTNRDGNAEVYSMNAEGSNRVNLTRNPSNDTDPHWSADGRRIAFVSDRDGNNEVFVMNGDGTGVVQVTHLDANSRWPSWTNDGRIIFHSGAFFERDVYIVKPDGTGLTNLTPGAADFAWADAAPTGRLIALSQFTEADGQHIFTLNLQSGALKSVTPLSADSTDVQANWSPTGNDLVFVRGTSDAQDLYIAHKDGTGLRRITNTPGRAESSPAFSPDGTKIVFQACTDTGTPTQHCANYVRNVDGTGEVEVTVTPSAPYLDTFSGTWVDPFWGVGSTGSGPTVVQTNGELEVTLPVGTSFGPNGFANAFAFMSCRLTGDFDMQVDYRLLSGPLPPQVDVNLDATEFMGDTYSGQHGMFVHNDGLPGISTHFPPDVFSPPYNDFIQDASLEGSLRLVRTTTADGTTVTASRLHGTPWSFTSVPYAPPTSQAANLNVFTNLAPFNTQVRVAYDNFLINSGAMTCPTWWVDSTPNWQPVTK
jgi:TolB protein